MIKKLISTIAILLISSNCVFAEDFHQTKTPEVIRGIQKYKEGNYIGCMQEIYPYIRKNDTNIDYQAKSGWSVNRVFSNISCTKGDTISFAGYLNTSSCTYTGIIAIVQN